MLQVKIRGLTNIQTLNNEKLYLIFDLGVKIMRKKKKKSSLEIVYGWRNLLYIYDKCDGKKDCEDKILHKANQK